MKWKTLLSYRHCRSVGPWVRSQPAAEAALTLAAASAAASAGAQSRTTRTTRSSRPSALNSRLDSTFNFDRAGTITVNATSGDVVITGWSRDQVHVRAVSDDDNIRLDASGSRLTVEAANSRRSGETRFELSVPYGVRVYTTSRSGDISVRGTRGQVEAHSQNGDVEVDDVMGRLDVNTVSGGVTTSSVSGDVEISTVNGDVRITDVRGNVNIGSVSGDIQMRGVTASLVRVKTTSGDVVYDGVIDPAGRYEFNTHSGDIGLHIPREVSAQLTISTWNGGINSDFPITLKPGEHGIGLTSTKRFSFQIGNGAARVTAETFSGDINIEKTGTP